MVDLSKKTSAGPCKSRKVVYYMVQAMFLDSSPVLRSTSIRVTVLGIYMRTKLFYFKFSGTFQYKFVLNSDTGYYLNLLLYSNGQDMPRTAVSP